VNSTSNSAAPAQFTIGRTGLDCDKRAAFLLNLSVRRILSSGKEYEDITRKEFADILTWSTGPYRDESLLQGFLYRDAA
jgi:hypothetical protein